jgi:hypothetical protein
MKPDGALLNGFQSSAATAILNDPAQVKKSI